MTNSGRAPRSGRKIQRIKIGSAQVPIYEGAVRGSTRFTIAFYRDGRRVRRTFGSLERAAEEARLAARKIQQGLAETTDMRPADRENYRAAIAMLRGSPIPLVAAVGNCSAMLRSFRRWRNICDARAESGSEFQSPT